jgi:virginiamycin B lyase
VTPAGKLFEYDIPFRNSRPIAIVPGPDGAMWFSEEAGSRVARIDDRGRITEYEVPKPAGQPNMLLAGLAFDGSGDLWVQQYVDQNNPGPAGEDYIVRIAAVGLKGGPRTLSPDHITRYPVKTGNTVMHRIIQGPDKAMWFTEMHSDKVGRLAAKSGRRFTPLSRHAELVSASRAVPLRRRMRWHRALFLAGGQALEFF